MKPTKHLPIICIVMMASCFNSGGQVNQDVLAELRKNFVNTDTYEFLFAEPELIEYCRDSVARSLFLQRIDNHKQNVKRKPDIASKTELLMLDILKRRIKAVDVSDQVSEESQDFLVRQLDFFRVDFELDDDMISSLIDHGKRDKATTEVCDVGVAMYLVFIYDQLRYIKALERRRSTDSQAKVYFPINCTLKEYDRSIILRQNMKAGLIEMLGSPKDDNLKKIYNDIKNCNLAGSYN